MRSAIEAMCYGSTDCFYKMLLEGFTKEEGTFKLEVAGGPSMWKRPIPYRLGLQTQLQSQELYLDVLISIPLFFISVSMSTMVWIYQVTLVHIE